MNAKWLGLGLLLNGAACSAYGTDPDSESPATHPSGAGKGGASVVLAQAGAANTAVAGAQAMAGAGQPSAGSGGAGTVSSSTAGAAGSAGSAAAGSAPTGGISGGPLGACPTPPAAGTLTDTLIDDLEDKDNGIAKLGGRSGFWSTFLDQLGSSITPKPDPTSPLLPGTTNCHGGTACVIVSGTTGMEDAVAMTYPYAGVGLDFSNAKKPCPYNGSAYTGIKLWARGDVEVTLKVNVSATADVKSGGTCTTGCSNGHGKKVMLTADWAQIDLPFASIMQDPTWGTQVAFDKAALLSLQVQFPSGGAFNAALDDVTFY